MIIALFALSVAMIVGGLLAAVLGWDIVLVERGWTMVIAGTVTAASGAVLLGITAAVSKLKKIQLELMRLHTGLSEAEPAALPSPSGLSLAALAGGLFGAAGALGAKEGQAKKTKEEPESQPVLPLFGDVDRFEREGESALASEGLEETRAEVDRSSDAFGTPFEPRISAVSGTPFESEKPTTEADVPAAKVPDFLFANRYRETLYTETSISETDEGLYVSEQTVQAFEPEFEEAEQPVDQGGAPEPEAVAEPEPVEPTPPLAPRSTAAVIGTYNSGDNKYVMFADGSIEAETPQGMFTFTSLDELKEFIASGGESNQKPAI
ncbi:hypothetical protein [Microvirga alba]|uniref:DUF308 domain-containing protein n=1 Tax=Microvirga alba TaxID=2791025 RepID=A0A931FP41_9HYPH|nr:hypothetical protein [Microvirga alba]MBF9232028.1 hypothetical protein [Microvirga alba]